jgi:hypothetical protein
MIGGIAKVAGLLILLVVVAGMVFMIYTLVTDFGVVESESDAPISKGENNSTVVWDSDREDIETIYIKGGDIALKLNEVGDSIIIDNRSDYEVSADFVDSYGGTYRDDLTTIDNGTIL